MPRRERARSPKQQRRRGEDDERERDRREEMDASTRSEASPWRSCAHSELMSRARDGVRAPNVAVVLMPVGHVDELGVHSDKATID